MVRLVSASTAIKYAKHLTGRLAFRLEEHFTDPNGLLSEQVCQSLPFWLSYILDMKPAAPIPHRANGLLCSFTCPTFNAGSLLP